MAELKLLRVALCAHDDLGKRYQLVLSVRGIGMRTALAIVNRMPELGQVSREEAAALAGLAPFTRQSGKLQGQAHIGGGRQRLRRPLFAAALAACLHWNPALQALYRRLLARGKSHTSAVAACARKLLIYPNTVIACGTPWTSREVNAEAAEKVLARAASAATFLGSAESAVPSPRPPSQTPPRAALLKHGRRPPPLGGAQRA